MNWSKGDKESGKRMKEGCKTSWILHCEYFSKERGKERTKDDSEIVRPTHSHHRPSAQAWEKAGQGVCCVFRGGPTASHKAPVWLGPLQKALALLSPRGWGPTRQAGKVTVAPSRLGGLKHWTKKDYSCTIMANGISLIGFRTFGTYHPPLLSYFSQLEWNVTQ